MSAVRSTVIVENTLPSNIEECNMEELVQIINTKVAGKHRAKLIQFVQDNNLNGKSFQKVENDALAKLLEIDEWQIYYDVRSPILEEFRHLHRIPLMQHTGIDQLNPRYIVEIEKKTLNMTTFTIINSLTTDGGSHLQLTTPLTPLQLHDFLMEILQDIASKEIIDVIVSYYPYKECMIGVSCSKDRFSKDTLHEIYQYLTEMGNKTMDIRQLETSGSYMAETSGKVQDIVDPSLFVKRVRGHYEYQWIPSTLQIVDEKLCQIKITSSINRFQRNNGGNVNKLFDIYETVISKMLPHFEDVTQQKLIKKGKKLQIICKALQYRMREGSIYGTHWHYDGVADVEHVVAIGILYTFNALPQSGMLEFAVDGKDLEFSHNRNDDKPTGDGKHFALNTREGTCIVWNNEKLQHRLGFLDNNGYKYEPQQTETDASEDKIRQAIVCMLVDPNTKIQTEKKKDFKLTLDEAKARRELVLAKRKGDIARAVPYCHDCGGYGHWHNGPGGFPSKPTVIKFVLD